MKKGTQTFLHHMLQTVELHLKKNAGYSGTSDTDAWANFREAQEFGVKPVIGVFIRMSDKWSRLKSIVKNPKNEQVNEPLSETLIDIVAYGLIALCLLDESVTLTAKDRKILDSINAMMIDREATKKLRQPKIEKLTKQRIIDSEIASEY